MSADPWAHRSAGMRCSTCMWFVVKELPPPSVMLLYDNLLNAPPAEQLATVADQPRSFVGRCRRHAPKLGGYPVVFSNDWCGDHKLDETKI